MAFIARDTSKLHSSDELHRSLDIPKKYLQSLLTRLSKHGLIASVKGKYGGFKLAKRAKDILVLDIIRATEELSGEYSCIFGIGNCALAEPCPLHDSWTNAQDQVFGVLSATKLSDLAG